MFPGGDPAMGMGLDLLVIEGADAGQRFTFDAGQALIGRQARSDNQSRDIHLSDPTVSPQQAELSYVGTNVLLTHHDRATTPTLVNGIPRRKVVLEPGDRVQMGFAVLEVQEHAGMSLSGIFPDLAPPGVGSSLEDADPDPPTPPGEHTILSEGFDDDGSTPTLLKPLAGFPRAQLTVITGEDLVSSHVIDVDESGLSVGRASASDLHVQDRGVSRRHAELVWEGGELVLVQRSPNNFTFVNGDRVTASRKLRNDDRIQISDVLVLEVSGLPKREDDVGARKFGDLSRAMEERLKLDQHIEREFLRRGSMLDVDVVGSSEMKDPTVPPAHIILSFERFRDFVANTVMEFDGVVLNSNGDELMCFFEDTLQAVRGGSAILERLDAFNRDQNLLTRPFRFRIGVHTGDCLVDLQNGRAFSPLVDLAGHLQKAAEPNGMMISADTLAAIPDGLPFEEAGELERHGMRIYRLASFLRD